MATHNKFECSNCGYTVRTSGLWEFYRDDSGQRQYYGHPIAKSLEARQRGVNGFSENLYCYKCDEVRDVIVYEFEKPMNDLEAWCEIVKPDYRKSFVLWFAARPAGFKGIVQWLGTMPTNSFRAGYYWNSKHRETPCPVCGGELLWSLKELKCPRCKEGVFDMVHFGMS